MTTCASASRAAFTLNALLLTAVQMGMIAAIYSPGVNAQLIGPFRPAAYLTAYLFLSLPNAFFATGDQKYKKWVTTYVDGWLERMKQNNGIIPTFVDLDGKIGGPTGKWWGSAYGWGFSPVNPVTNRRENRNRIERPIIGFNNALLLTGDDDPLGVEDFHTHQLPLAQAPEAYETFQKKEDGAFKVVFRP